MTVMNREQLLEMDIIDLVRHANQSYGLGVTKDYNRFDIINQIEQSNRKFKGNALMRVVDEGTNERVGPGMMKVRIRPGKYDRIPRPVIIGHQFKIASVPVNRDVIMPARYLSCFEDAVQDTYFTDELTKEWVVQPEHAYSYSVLEMGPAIGKKGAQAPVRRPLAQPQYEDEPEPEAPVPTKEQDDAVLKAIMALGAQMEQLNTRVAQVEAKAAKPTPAQRKKRTAKKAVNKEEN